MKTERMIDWTELGNYDKRMRWMTVSGKVPFDYHGFVSSPSAQLPFPLHSTTFFPPHSTTFFLVSTSFSSVYGRLKLDFASSRV